MTEPEHETNFADFVANLRKSGEFYMFSTKCSVWDWLLFKLGRKFFPKDEVSNDTIVKRFGCIELGDEEGRVYWLDKGSVPIEVIAKTFSLTPEQIESTTMIHLLPFPEVPKEPTVHYVGEA